MFARKAGQRSFSTKTLGRPPSLPKNPAETLPTGSKGKLRAQISTPVVHRSRVFFAVYLGIIFFNFQCWKYAEVRYFEFPQMFFLRHLWGCFWSRHDLGHVMMIRISWSKGVMTWLSGYMWLTPQLCSSLSRLGHDLLLGADVFWSKDLGGKIAFEVLSWWICSCML